MDNHPISEQYRSAAILWVDADAAANLLEETKSAIFADMVAKLISENIKLAINRAEVLVKSSPEWREFVTQMVEHRRQANLHKVQMDYLRMKFSEQQSIEATHRAEARL
jgi:DNA polymerase III gamma/tau subunit